MDTLLNTGDNAWIMVSSALVLLMTPGLALFYAGLGHSRSAINTINMSFICLGCIPVIWALVGYSLAFAPGNAIIGNLQYLFLNNVSSQIPSGSTVPGYDPMIFQMMFAVVSPALISGALVGRIKFRAYVIFIILWSLFVYSLVAHWVWSPMGWLNKLGALDFAGGTVVHINAGIAAFVVALRLSPKQGRHKEETPHNVPFVVLGGSLLWFGWYGFNAGSAGAANGIASLTMVTTTLATAAAVFTWLMLNFFRNQRATAVGFAVAVVIGLVAITPASGYVSPLSAMLIGIIATTICYFAILWKNKLFKRIQDPLDVFICHGISGIVGALLTGVFASKALNPGGANGLLYGNPELLLYQLVAVLATIAASGLGTLIILLILEKCMTIQPPSHDPEKGIDLSEHGESAYEDLSTLMQELSLTKQALSEANQKLQQQRRSDAGLGKNRDDLK